MGSLIDAVWLLSRAVASIIVSVVRLLFIVASYPIFWVANQLAVVAECLSEKVLALSRGLDELNPGLSDDPFSLVIAGLISLLILACIGACALIAIMKVSGRW